MYNILNYNDHYTLMRCVLALEISQRLIYRYRTTFLCMELEKRNSFVELKKNLWLIINEWRYYISPRYQFKVKKKNK